MHFPLRFPAAAPALGVILALSLTPAASAQTSRLSNVSVRTNAGGSDTLITGFTVAPGADKQILVRAVGPTLGAFGVGGTLGDPKLELYSGAAKSSSPASTPMATRTSASTSVDEYAATLATWFGVSATNLPLVLPNIGRFPQANLGFL